MQIIPLAAGFGKGFQHEVIAFLVTEPAQSHKVQLIGVGGKIRGFPGFGINLLCIDGVLNDGELGRVKDAGAGHKRLNHPLRHPYETVIVLKFILEIIPQHPVLPLIFQLDGNVIVNPHDPALGGNGKGAQGAGELVGIEIHRQVIFPAIPKIQADHVPGYIKGNKGADTGNVFQILDIQLRGKLHLPKGTSVRQIQVHLKMFIVKVSKKVHQRFLDASYVKIILKECDSLHSDILTNCSCLLYFNANTAFCKVRNYLHGYSREKQKAAPKTGLPFCHFRCAP